LSIGCKNYISKHSKPKDPDISISIQHTNIIEFSCTISQEHIPINKYSNILKSTKTKKNKGRHREYQGMRRDVQRMPKSREKSARKTHNMT
jgi:hypothetical protein